MVHHPAQRVVAARGAAQPPADSFGRQNAATVFGWVFCAHQIGAALAAWLGGVARDFTGDYGVAFLAAGVLAVAATGLSLSIRGAPAAALATD